VFLVVVDSTIPGGNIQQLQTEAEQLVTSLRANLEIHVTGITGPTMIAAQLQGWPVERLQRLGGVIEIGCVPTLKTSSHATPQVAIEVYHDAFPALAGEHLDSPEYSFKFASDSALLAIHLNKTLTGKPEKKGGIIASPASVEIRPMAANPAGIPRDILVRTVRLARLGDPAADTDRPINLMAPIVQACSGFLADHDCHIMGMISDKARRHGRIEDMEIQIIRGRFPEKAAGETATRSMTKTTSKPVAVVKPWTSGLYCASGLDAVAFYALKVIDKSRPARDFWHELDEASFVTSSLQGVVRTVPLRTMSYSPVAGNATTIPAVIAPPAMLDYVIEGATVFNGSKDRPRFVADVGIAGQRIVQVGDLKSRGRRVSIAGTGLFLMPGFVDIHSHADGNILQVADAASHIRQGITTVLAGNCSFSPVAVGAFLAELDHQGIPLNIGMLLGNAGVREKVMGTRMGKPSDVELRRQKELVDLAMEEGAYGLSTGLIYRVSEQSFTFELAELAKQLKPYGGFYASHVRDESDVVLDAIREAIHIGELAEVPVHISHVKVIGRNNWGAMERYLEIMKVARSRGLDVTGDQYPWRASGPAAHYTLHKLLLREAIRGEHPEVVLLKDMPEPYTSYSGRPLTELLAAERITPEQLAMNLKLQENSRIYATYLCLDDADVCRAMRDDHIAVCTDASLASTEDIRSGKGANEHPRKFRSYPEFFARYVRDRGVCSWELGVYKATGMPAQRMGLTDRGVIRAGAYADLILLDPAGLDPAADYRDQRPAPRGIQWVFLNGRPVLKAGEFVGGQHGQALRFHNRRKP